MPEQRERLEEIAERVHRSAFHNWAGLTVTRVAPGEVDVVLETEPHHLNLVGIVHGGVIATIANTATGIALRTILEPGLSHVTAQLNVHFLAPGKAGKLTGRGRALKAGRRMGYAEADVVDEDGQMLARASATFIVMPERTGQ